MCENTENEKSFQTWSCWNCVSASKGLGVSWNWSWSPLSALWTWWAASPEHRWVWGWCSIPISWCQLPEMLLWPLEPRGYSVSCPVCETVMDLVQSANGCGLAGMGHRVSGGRPVLEEEHGATPIGSMPTVAPEQLHCRNPFSGPF